MLKQRLLLAIFLLPFGIYANEIYQQHYIERYSKLAIKEMNQTGIPASIKLAQGILESSWGRSDSASKYNNHFGIKCKNDWAGNRFLKEDDDYDAQGNLIASCFRAYSAAEDSYEDHSSFLKDNPRYKELFSYGQKDYISWAVGLQRCGYATNKQYAVKLIDLIERYGLYKYDKIELSTTPELAVQEDGGSGDNSTLSIAPSPTHYRQKPTIAATGPVAVYLPFEIVPAQKDRRIAKVKMSQPVSRKLSRPLAEGSIATEETTLGPIKTTRFTQMKRQPRVKYNDIRR